MENLTRKQKSRIGAVILLGIFLFAYLKLKSWEEQWHLSVIPYGLSVSKILYVSEESWGFGPGGNETGIIIFELPSNVAQTIEKDGINYFAKLPKKSRKQGEWRGHYEKWGTTPASFNSAWSGPESNGEVHLNFVPRIATYLNRYGFGVPIDPALEREIDEAISKPGSFLAYGRSGVLIVIPRARKIVYAYHG